MWTPKQTNKQTWKHCPLHSQVTVLRGWLRGGYWSRFVENKMVVSHFTDNKFGISRFTSKTTFLDTHFFLLWLRTITKELPCSMSSPFSRFLFLVLWKGNRVLCLEVEARHHLLLIQNHCHQRSRHRIVLLSQSRYFDIFI